MYDVAQACWLALETPDANNCVFNLGSGNNVSIRELAERMAAALGKKGIEPEITGKYRVGDIRHCFADISLARRGLGYEPKISLEKGLQDPVARLEGQAAVDRVEAACAELSARGLTV